MKILTEVDDMRSAGESARRAGKVVGFVPTMGALHDGHLSLVRMAREQSEVVVASIFVNPLQFGPNEDFDSYPRDMEGDLELLEGAGADTVFMPAVEDMYPPDADTILRAGELGAKFEGAERPGHFDGVLTVMAKLLNIVGPHEVFLGQKDAQQVAVLKRMIADLHYDVEVVVGPIVREGTGIALSSRNAYLSAAQLEQAAALYRSLCAGAEAYGETGEAAAAEEAMAEVLGAAEGVQTSYASAVDPMTFRPPSADGRVLLIVAARVGGTRLIDNLLIE